MLLLLPPSSPPPSARSRAGLKAEGQQQQEQQQQQQQKQQQKQQDRNCPQTFSLALALAQNLGTAHSVQNEDATMPISMVHVHTTSSKFLETSPSSPPLPKKLFPPPPPPLLPPPPFTAPSPPLRRTGGIPARFPCGRNVARAAGGSVFS